MAEQTIPEKTVVIDNPEQASTNFYWTWDTEGQVFNLQTTVRGVLTYEQVQAHIKTAMETMAHVQQLGGVAKQVGKGADTSKVTTTITAELPMIGGAPGETETVETEVDAIVFATEKLSVTESEKGKYFKVKGGKYSKFGVTVWPEVLTKVGIDPNKAEVKEYPFVGWQAVCTVKDGNPHKVIELRKV